MRELQVAVRERGDAAVLDLRGDVDRSADERLTEAYSAARDAGARRVVLNFTEADYINSTGIAVIVGLLAQARAEGVQIAAWGLSAHYREIFEITRLADYMTITDDEDGALQGEDGSKDE